MSTDPAAMQTEAPIRLAYVVGASFFAAAYLLLLLAFSPGSFLDAFLSALVNLFSLLPWVLAARSLVRSRIVRLAGPKAAAANIVLACLFALGWYWSLTIGLGVLRGGSLAQFTVLPFRSTAFGWQVLQGLAIYAAVAALAWTESVRSSARLGELSQSVEPAARQPSRYFIRVGDEYAPIDVDRIVTIVGADDYAEVVTRSGRHLAKITLAELEEQLGPNFIRAHRSRIVNVDCISRVEPAGGGRLTLFLDNGEVVHASRTGAKRIRDRVI